MSRNSRAALPAVVASKPRLRVLGTSVTQVELLKSAAERDIGIHLDFITLDGTEAQRRGALAPQSFDVYDQWFHDLNLVWPAGSLRGIDIERIANWGDINDLPKTGKLSPSSSSAPGGDPSKRLYVQLDRSLGSAPTDQISMLPTVHNADGFAIVGGNGHDATCWADFLDSSWAGKVILQRDAAIGSLEILLALQATEQMRVADPGNLGLEEIEQLTDHLAHYVSAGQFRQVWADEAEAVAALQGGSDLIGSLWWSGAIKLRRLGVPVRIVEPAEGYRAWFGGMSLSSRLEGRDLDVAYEYLNWWLDGYAGAIMARQGSYIANPEASRGHLSDAEWEFWYEGKPARVPICDRDGQTVFDVGEIRGPSYEARMSKIAIWDAVMDEHNYLVRRWDHVLTKV